MKRSEVVEQVIEFIESEFPSQGLPLTESTNLLDDWFVDSLGIIETVLFLEKRFGVGVSRSDINGTNFRDVAAISDFVQSRLSS